MFEFRLPLENKCVTFHMNKQSNAHAGLHHHLHYIMQHDIQASAYLCLPVHVCVICGVFSRRMFAWLAS